MDIRTMRKLEKMGYDKDWLTVIKREWKPKKNGFYEIRITDIQNISDDPRTGVFIETTTFCNDYDLSVVLYYFEGNAYVLTDLTTMESIGSGILDDSVFDVMSDHTGERWDMFSGEEVEVEMGIRQTRRESMIDRLTRENNELELEVAKLRMELKKYKELEERA